MNRELRDLYYQYFEVRADVGDEKQWFEEALKLRFQVYCVEHNWEDRDAFPDGMERDEYDSRSLHSLLIHQGTREVAGTVRLIRADAVHPQGSLPIDLLCREPALADEMVIPRARVAEISRFAISKVFRRRAEDVQSPTGVGPDWSEHSPIDQRRLPHMSVGLVAAMIHCSYDHGITHWVAEMEPALLRMYAKLGVHWTHLGPPVEFRGKRQPCYTKLPEMLARAQQERPDIWDLIANGGDWTQPVRVDTALVG